MGNAWYKGFAAMNEGERNMVKGTYKQMIVATTPDSVYYEQAYFVLREAREADGASEDSMIAEANRILDACRVMPMPRKPRRISSTAAFALGALAGGIFVGLLCLVALILL